MSRRSAVIAVHQESLRERPRVHKLAIVLSKLGVSVEIWKFGPAEQTEELGFAVRNLISGKWRAAPPVLRYLIWMLAVFFGSLRYGRGLYFFAVGFDSAFPLSMISGSRRWLVFDNLDNISMNYRWPRVIAWLFGRLESWTAWRAKLHVIPSRARWSGNETNLRVVTNTPSRDAVNEAASIAHARCYTRELPLTIYLNGWLSATRGIRTLLSAMDILRAKQVPVRVLVAGRPASEDVSELLAHKFTENLGMLTNAEALAIYYRSHVAFTYYDPSRAINRVAESQKWTDCWATGTPFISNMEIETLEPYIRQNACFALPYSDADGLAQLLSDLARQPEMLADSQRRLRQMSFRYWDDEMRVIACEWLSLPRPPVLAP